MPPYEILGVSRTATQTEIKSAFRKLAAQYHPDKHAGNPLGELAAEKFRQIKEAYELLSNPELRAAYDATGTVSDGSQAESGTDGHSSADYTTERVIHEVEALLDRRMFGDVINKLTSMIENGAKDVRLYVYRGVAYRSQGNLAMAIPDLVHAAAQAQNDPGIQELAGSTLVEANQPQKAVPYLRRTITQVGEAPDTLSLMALALEQSGQTAEAKAYWSRVREIDPNNQILMARDAHFKIGSNFVSKSDSTSGACCLCVLFECIFDCC